MCLAISPGNQYKRSRFAERWHRIARTPLRLFLFAAIVHLLIVAGIVVSDYFQDTAIVFSYFLTGAVFGLVALPVFGYIMTRIPEKYSMPAMHYGRYSSIYMLFMLALALLEFSVIYGSSWVVAGLWLLVPAWLLAITSIWNLHIWIPARDQYGSLVLVALLSVMLVMLVAHILTLSLDLLIPDIISLLALVLIWPAVFILTVVVSKHASHKGSEISV